MSIRSCLEILCRSLRSTYRNFAEGGRAKNERRANMIPPESCCHCVLYLHDFCNYIGDSLISIGINVIDCIYAGSERDYHNG